MAKKKLTYVFGADLSELERAWKRIDRSMNKLSAQFKKVGSTMTKTFTVPLVAMGAAATKAALDIDDAMDAIASGTGATGRALKSLQDDWKKLAGSVTQGFDVSAKVLADYNTRLGLTGNALTDISQKALDAARLLGEDVNSVVSQSAKAMRDWAIPAGEMGKFMDVLFKASQATGIQIGTLSTQLYKYGAALRGMGFDLESSVALLAQFEQQGVNTERIMGSLSRGLSYMARKGITDAGEAFRLLVEQIKNAKTPTEATRLAIEVFGSRAGPDMALAIREGRFSVEQLIAILRDAEGAIQQTTKATDGFAEQWPRIKNKIMLAIEPLGTEILNIAESAMPKIEDSVASAATAIGNASDDTKKKILALAATLAVGGPLLLAISATIKSLATLGGTFLALASGPAAPIILATAAVWGLIDAYKNLDQIQKKVTGTTPQEALERGKYLERAGEIFRERRGKYPLTAKDYEEVNRIVDELISKTIEQKEIAAIKTPSPTTAVASAVDSSTLQFLTTGGKKGKSPLYRLTWEYQQGLISAEKYFATLQTLMTNLKPSAEDFQALFSAKQAAAIDIVNEKIDELINGLIAGTINTSEFATKVEGLRERFAGLPLAQKAITDVATAGMKEYVRQVGVATAAEIERINKIKQEQLDAQEAAAEGVAKFWQDVNWEYSQGLIDAQSYFEMLRGELQRVTEGSEAWKNAFSELQRVGQDIASINIKALSEQFESGKITAEEYRSELEALKAQFSDLPLVVKALDDAIKNVGASSDKMKDFTKELGMTFESAFENAIVKGEDLRSVMSGLLEDIARIILRMYVVIPLVNSVMGFMSSAFGLPAVKMHGGGVVGAGGTISLVPAGADEFPAILQKGEVVLPKDFGKTNVDVQPNIRIINVLDPSIVGNYLATPDGERVIVNVMQKNKGRLM
jgi:hypothetical protein